MSFNGELRKLDPSANPFAYDAIRAAVQAAAELPLESQPTTTAERIDNNGLGVLSIVSANLDEVLPPHFSTGQRAAFSNASRLFAHSVCELALQGNNRGLASELQYMSGRRAMPNMVAAAVQVVAENRLEAHSPDEILAVAGSTFPVLTMISGELSFSQLDTHTPDDLDGFHEGLFHYAATLGSLALQEETELRFGGFPGNPNR